MSAEDDLAEEETLRAQKTKDRWSFAVLCFIIVCINTTFSLMAPIFPTEAERRGILPVVTGIIFAVYNFGNFIASPFLGQLMQRRYISRKKMMTLGIISSSLSMVGFGLARRIPDRQKSLFSVVCILLRIMNGLGAAAADTSSTAITADLFQQTAWLGTALGITEACLAIGWMIGPLFGGYLAVWGGFSLPFYFAAALGFFSLPFAFLIPGRRSKPNPSSLQASISPWSLLRHMEITLFLLSAALSAAAVTFIDATIAPFLKNTLHWSESTIGDLFAILSISYCVGTLLGGLLSDLFSPRHVILIGTAIQFLPFATLAPSPLLQPLLCHLGIPRNVLVWVSCTLIGFAISFGFAPVAAAILRYTEEVNIQDDGLPDLVGGLASSFYYLGGSMGPIVGGSLQAGVGFGWATTIYCGAILLISIVLISLLFLSRYWRKNRSVSELQTPLITESSS